MIAARRGVRRVRAGLAPALLLTGQAFAADLTAIVRDQSGQPVPDAVVFVYEVSGATFTPPADPAILDQIGKEYAPHVLPILAGTRVRFPNKDNIHHHVYSFSPCKTFELPLYKGEPAQPVLFDKVGVAKLGCNIHDWMAAVVLVLDNPYFAVTNASGTAALAGLPAGPWPLAVWHERAAVSVEATRRMLAAGTTATAFSLPIKPAPPRRSRPLTY